MTREEAIKLLRIIKVAYPTAFKDMKEKDAEDTILLYMEMLSDYPFEVIAVATKSLISTFKFPPTVANIREELVKITTARNKQLTVDEAWEEACKAVRRYGSYDQQGALDSLSPTTRLVVQRMGYRDLCMSENIMADRAHFIRIYEALENRQRYERQIPAQLRDTICVIQDKFSLPEGIANLRGLSEDIKKIGSSED